jgi:hypothetical protein
VLPLMLDLEELEEWRGTACPFNFLYVSSLICVIDRVIIRSIMYPEPHVSLSIVESGPVCVIEFVCPGNAM